MLWKSSSASHPSLNRSVGPWLKDIDKWHRVWLKAHPGEQLDYQVYLYVITICFANLAKAEWCRQSAGKKKIAEIDSFMSIDDEGGMHMDVLQTLDYIAEHTESDFRLENMRRCHDSALRMLGK
jgi:hypothetical protein